MGAQSDRFRVLLFYNVSSSSTSFFVKVNSPPPFRFFPPRGVDSRAALRTGVTDLHSSVSSEPLFEFNLLLFSVIAVFFPPGAVFSPRGGAWGTSKSGVEFSIFSIFFFSVPILAAEYVRQQRLVFLFSPAAFPATLSPRYPCGRQADLPFPRAVVLLPCSGNERSHFIFEGRM